MPFKPNCPICGANRNSNKHKAQSKQCDAKIKELYREKICKK